MSVQLIDCVDNWDERQSELKLKTVPAGCRGVKYGCPATLADAADGIVHAWCQNVSQETIINCWLKAKILTPQAMLQLAGMSKKLQRHIAAAAKVDDFKKLVDILANLKVEVVQQELESSVALMMTSAEVVAQSRPYPNAAWHYQRSSRMLLEPSTPIWTRSSGA